ncbi:hypothetical protein WN51_04000 [Melipona quadrifasciata]|uniref:Uncharacterized protein n=1 Tax=Melipona quadrifasciata TaxID=166423 RepID=A0A0N0BCE4_9HYME|nr:hypothetical protein WN51_04000 [Melipona quadrifasciata]
MLAKREPPMRLVDERLSSFEGCASCVVEYNRENVPSVSYDATAQYKKMPLPLEVYPTPPHESRDPNQPIANFRCISVAPEEARFSGAKITFSDNKILHEEQKETAILAADWPVLFHSNNYLRQTNNDEKGKREEKDSRHRSPEDDFNHFEHPPRNIHFVEALTDLSTPNINLTN